MATFSEFISELTLEQVSDWWNNIAPKQAPEKDENQNWKYWISKGGKKLPFKYVVRSIAEHKKVELENFGSNDNTRNQFSSKYDFDIDEELVFDLSEKQRFIDFYKNKIKEGENFHIFLDYVSDVVEKAGIKPYNVRMAINKMNEVLVIISMRNVLSYSEQEGKSILGFIIEKIDLKRFKDDVNEYKTYPYKGGDDKVFLEIEVNDWKDVPPDLLTANLIEIKEYYQKEKTSKFIRWNSEAKTSNSVLKYLVFNKISADDFISNKSKIAALPELFFTKQTFDVLRDSANKKYNKNEIKDVDTYEFLRGEYVKVKHWANVIKTKIFPDGVIDIIQNPINRAGNFDGYLWAKIYPTKSDAKIKRLAYTIGLDKDHHYNVKIDTVGGLDSEDPIRQQYETYRGDFFNSEIVKRMDYKDEKVKDWNNLFDFSTQSINGLIPHYNRLKNILFPQNISAMKQPLNKILYGPPGTGKTYILQNSYFKQYTIENASETKEQFLLKLIADLTWWEVIALAIYEMKETRVPELANHHYVKIKNSLSSNKQINTMLWGSLQAHTVDQCENVKFAKRLSPQIFTKTTDSVWSIVTETLSEAPQIIDLYREIGHFNPRETSIQKNYEMVTFHQNFSYEDFIEGIKPDMSSNSFDFSEATLTYEISRGLFHNACTEAVRLAGYTNIQECIDDSFENRKAKLESAKPYAIFIDEINRANVSSVFGELITLIEDDKRLGAKNEITDIQLPYSKTKFAVPMNLHIIGTMNTADRSVESLDTALRRRFAFEEMMPDPKSLTKTINKISLSELLTVINERVEVLLDRDHTIGHSYLIDINDAGELKSAFKNKIIPLLQEYFFGDYGKIGLILGEGFVSISNTKKASFANFKYDGHEEFVSAKYQLIPIDDSFDIIKALTQLLEKK